MNFLEPKITFNKSTMLIYKNIVQLIIFLAVSTFSLFIFIRYCVTPGYYIYTTYSRGTDLVNTILTDIDNKNLSNIDVYLTYFENLINELMQELSVYDFFGEIELTKGYHRNFIILKDILIGFARLVREVYYVTQNILVLNEFDLGLNMYEMQHLVSVDQKKNDIFFEVVRNLPRYVDAYQKIYPNILELIQKFNSIDLSYLPETSNFNIREKVDRIKHFLTTFAEHNEDIVQFMSSFSEFVGSNKKVHYLVIFQNETEMRGSGGLLTAFGILQVENGKIINNFEVKDTWKPQYDIWNYGVYVGLNNIYGQNFLMNYGCGATELRIQDSGMYPDAAHSIELFLAFYDRLRSILPHKYPHYDHVILLNMNFVESILKIIGEIEFEDRKVTAELLFDFIKEESDSDEYLYSGKERKQIIGDLTEVIHQKIVTLSFDTILELVDSIVMSIKARDISIYTKNDSLMRFLDFYQMSGRFEKEYIYDYLHVNEAQNCALKMNKFLRNHIEQNIYINQDGTIKKDISVRWLQEKVYQPWMIKQYPSTINFLYRAWVRIVIPYDSINVVSDGFYKSSFLKYVPVVYHDHVFNKLVSDNVIRFDHRRFSYEDPPRKHDLNVSYVLSHRLNFFNTNNLYRLLLQKHPGKSWEIYKINISYDNKNFSVEFILDQDKEVTFDGKSISIKNYRNKLDWILDLTHNVRDILFELK
ncbi:MAG: DUF4012 domain-containing protein [Candidatus Dojkabacteria bacterium]|nr:DUF4012 domain-containing protein [Candidatus Dojkabacteria bacterium]